MVKVEVGFVEEFAPEEREVIKDVKEWKTIPAEKFVKVLEKSGKNDWAEIVKEKANELGVKEVKYGKVKTETNVYEVFDDTKNVIVIKSPYKKRKKAVQVEKVKKASNRGKKKKHVLEMAKKYLEMKGEFTIGEFLKWLKENHDETYYRPYVFNILKKEAEIEYRDVGKRKVIFVTGLKE